MRTCPHCGSELHDDSTFCFACMSIVNERKELLIKVNTSRKRTIPMVCVAVAIIAASSVFAVVSKKNNAVETKTPEPAKAVTTSATVTTIPQTTTAATTTVPTTTTAPAPTADEIDIISGGIRQASTGTAELLPLQQPCLKKLSLKKIMVKISLMKITFSRRITQLQPSPSRHIIPRTEQMS